MPGDGDSVDTGGGAGVQGNVDPGHDFVGRDQYNYYTLLPDSRAEYSLISSLSKEELAAIYRKATTAHFNGDLIQAKAHYEKIARHDPDYPGVAQSLHAINKELARPYVDMHGRVLANRIFSINLEDSPYELRPSTTVAVDIVYSREFLNNFKRNLSSIMENAFKRAIIVTIVIVLVIIVLFILRLISLFVA